MKLSLRKLILISLFAIIPVISHAGGVITEAKVVGVYCGRYGSSNMCSVYFNVSSTSAPACAGYKIRMQLSTDTAVGRAMLAVALDANNTKKIVDAQGTGACSIWSDTEDLNMIFIAPPCNVTANTWGCTNN